MLQLKTLVEPSIISLLGAFAPIVLGLAIQNSDVLWRGANALLLFMHFIGFASFIARGSKSGVELSHKIMLAIFFLIVFFQLGSIFNLVASHQLAFALSLIYGVCAGIHNFYLLLFYSGDNTA